MFLLIAIKSFCVYRTLSRERLIQYFSLVIKLYDFKVLLCPAAKLRVIYMTFFKASNVLSSRNDGKVKGIYIYLLFIIH